MDRFFPFDFSSSIWVAYVFRVLKISLYWIDPEFKKILQSKKRQLITLEKGISQIEDELDNESLFSNNRDFDSDDEFKALESLAIQNKAEHLLLKCRKKYNYYQQMVLKKKLEKIK